MACICLSDAAPGLSGYQFTDFSPFGYDAAVNSTGKIAFAAQVRTSPQASTALWDIWPNRSGTPQPVYIQSQPATQAGVGYTFGGVLFNGPDQKLFIGDDNTITYFVALNGPAQTVYNLTEFDSLWSDSGTALLEELFERKGWRLLRISIGMIVRQKTAPLM